jgi:hypothetical protein
MRNGGPNADRKTFLVAVIKFRMRVRFSPNAAVVTIKKPPQGRYVKTLTYRQLILKGHLLPYCWGSSNHQAKTWEF